ncbi:hypothetical protein [Curtobacterium sp. RRHDQ10]|uniref:tetratricopeptide repeat protein n=1 Tax=Curtobacterium phyllosphaerae TaxID=3413379 RepID=UPI003BF04A92
MPRGDRPRDGAPRQGGFRGDERPRSDDRFRSDDRSRSDDRPRGGDDARGGDQRRDGDRPRYSDRASRPDDRGRTFGDRAQRGPRDDRGGSDGGDRRRFGDGSRSAGARFGEASRDDWEDRDPFGTRSIRPRHEDPDIPEGIDARDLDKVARSELKTLSKDNSDWVAKHLVAASLLIDDDPELAHQHALSAGRRAGRVAVVRETLAITSYRLEDFATALRELRTYRRISGRNDQLPMMVDCERGLGRPERALELGRSVDKAALDAPVQVELAIAMSGARLDLGNPAAALAELEIPQLDPTTAYSWSPGLYSAYAATLEELGRQDEADEWWARVDRAAEALAEAADEDAWETIDVVEETIEGTHDTAGEHGEPTEHGEPGEHGESREHGEPGEHGGEPVVGGVESDDLVEPGDGVTGDDGLDEGPDVAGGIDDDDIDDGEFEIDEENPTDVDGSGADH